MIYNLIIALYTSAVGLAALFNKKVALMVKGEKESFDILQKQIILGEKYLWFHAASLGEFEQGRPLIEEIRKTYPQYKILQTFFPLPDMKCERTIKELTLSVIFRWTPRAT